MTVTMAAEAGQLQLNVFEPIIAFRLLAASSALRNACRCSARSASTGIVANPKVMWDAVERSIGLVTALLPELGYEVCTQVAKDALESGRGVVELLLEKRLLTREQIDEILDPSRMTRDQELAMAGTKLDGAGAQKMKRWKRPSGPTTIHGHVERIRST